MGPTSASVVPKPSGPEDRREAGLLRRTHNDNSTTTAGEWNGASPAFSLLAAAGSRVLMGSRPHRYLRASPTLNRYQRGLIVGGKYGLPSAKPVETAGRHRRQLPAFPDATGDAVPPSLFPLRGSGHRTNHWHAARSAGIPCVPR